MARHELKPIMNPLDDAVSAYATAVTNLTSKEAGKSKAVVIEILNARDKVASALTNGQSVESEVLMRVNELDQKLKRDAGRIKSIAGHSLAEWRESFHPGESAWWWSLDVHRPVESKLESFPAVVTAGTWLCWISIAFSLTFIVEFARRFVATEADLPGIVLQGLLALLVGGAVFQLVGQVAGRFNSSTGKPHHNLKSLLLLSVLAIASVATAVGIEVFRSAIVDHYNSKGVAYKLNGQQTAAIANYRRAISLKPNDSLAHYNLASAYEGALDYDKAESEFQAAISCDDQYSLAYNRLARLYMLRRGDYVSALMLLKTGLDKLEMNKEHNLLNERDYRDTRFALLRNRGWAYFGLGYFTQAANDLNLALEIRPDGAVAHCLLAQVLEAEKNPQRNQERANEEYEKCVADSLVYGDIEENWLSLARERLLSEGPELQKKGKSK